MHSEHIPKYRNSSAAIGDMVVMVKSSGLGIMNCKKKINNVDNKKGTDLWTGPFISLQNVSSYLSERHLRAP